MWLPLIVNGFCWQMMVSPSFQSLQPNRCAWDSLDVAVTVYKGFSNNQPTPNENTKDVMFKVQFDSN